MINAPDGNLHVYILSVGQADTTVIISPGGRVIVIDARRPGKLIRLLDDLGLDGTIEHLIITHPHDDHFSGGNRLALEKNIEEATVAPFWHEFGMGPPTYRRLIGRLQAQDTNVTFLSGYSRWYPDEALMDNPGGGDPILDPDAPFLELLGPTNGMVRLLEDANIFNTNHLTIMSRLAWRSFRMISTGDAQMENWSFFDSERMMEGACQVLRAAHHGSPNGTQWERINRLSPSQVIISSDPGAGHHLPDLTSTAIFTKFDSVDGQMAIITRDAGTIHLRVTPSGGRTLRRFNDLPANNVNLNAPITLSEQSNPTDWPALLDDRVANL
jgi:competence protein ComEC